MRALVADMRFMSDVAGISKTGYRENTMQSAKSKSEHSENASDVKVWKGSSGGSCCWCSVRPMTDQPVGRL